MKNYFSFLFLFIFLQLTLSGQTAFGPSHSFNSSEFYGGTYASVLTNDLDGDGDEDVIFIFERSDTIAWYENDGFGNFNSQKRIIDTDLNKFRSIYIVDLDGDGDNDVLSSSKLNKVAWYENDGLGNFGSEKIITTSVYGVIIVYPIDLDGDGDQDVLATSSSPDLITWYENDGLGNFGSQRVITSSADGTYSIHAIDLDGDGDMDVLSASKNDDEIAWYENDGLGNFGSQKIISTNVWGAYQVYAIDISGDGIPDVLSASQYDGKIAWYKNDGNGNFGSQRIISNLTLRAQSIFASDLDNDGDQDVLCAIFYAEIGIGKIVWFENNGVGNFGSMQVIIEDNNIGHLSVYAADIDGDNDIDVVGAKDIKQEIFWHENFLGLEFTTIGGSIYWDKNNDNDFSLLEDKPFVGIKVSEEPEGRNTYTNFQGDYNLTLVNPRTHTITVPTPVNYDCIGKINFTSDTLTNPFNFNYEAHTNINQDYVFTGLDRDCRKLSGLVFDDKNANGILDNGENGLPGILLNIGSFGNTFSQSDGRYSIYLPNYDSSSITLNLINNLSTNGYCQGIDVSQTFPYNNMGYMISSNSGNQSNLTFGVNQVVSSFFDVGLYTLVVQEGNKAGEAFHSWMDFKSFGLTNETCTLRINHDPLLTLLNSNIPVSNQGADFVEWVFPNGSAPSFWCMQMNWYLDSSAEVGGSIHWVAIYKCGSEVDSCLQNDQIIRDVTIVSGPLRQREEVATLYSMRTEGSMPEVINKDEVLSYVITFNNPLETTAYDVTIIDRLPNILDLSTISFPFSSFPNYDFTIRESGEMLWELKDINLSDASIDEQNSYGFVQFNVRLKENLPYGTIIPNKAKVYFNGIEPFETNEVRHKLENVVSVVNQFNNDIEVNLYPNPFSNTTTLILSDPLSFNYDLRLFDVTGKEVRNYFSISETSFIIEKENLPSGLYFLSIYRHKNQDVLGNLKLIID